MSQFSSKLITIEQLFLNNDGSEDKGKNYFIPIYQRDFVWNKDDIEKFIGDIFNIMEDRDSAEYNEYFIGGIVLCSESVLGVKRSNISLEVIDGQQRLTTLSIILSFLYQYLHFRNKNFGSKDEYVNTIKEKILSLIKYKKTNNITQDVINMFRVERSDDIADLYQDALNELLTTTIEDFTFLNKLVVEDNPLVKTRQEEFIDLMEYTNKLFSVYNEDQLVGFSIQLLEYTKVVVTKTKDIETGYLVFEKLNDNGKKLNPDDLLKNYLFSKASRDEYLTLDADWKIFLKEIYNINERGSKISPKEFLESYLIIKGIKVTSDKSKIFKIFKEEIYDEKQYTSLEFLDELKKTVSEYATLKRDEVISKYLKLLGFKLGYVIFLSLYKKLNSLNYKEHKYNIFIDVFRLGFCYILTDNSKLLSQKVPEICKLINDLKEDEPARVLNYLKTLINDAIEIVEEEFADALTNSNLFDRRKNLTIELFNILNFYINNNKYYNYSSLKLVQIIPRPKKLNTFDMTQIKDINVDNITKYSKLLGNLTLVKFNTELDEISMDLRLEQLEMQKKLFILPSIAHKNLLINSKEKIEKRSLELYKASYDLFYENKLSMQYFINSDSEYYFIERSESKNAVMVQIDENQYKVLAGSRCNIEHHDSWSYNSLKNTLLQEKILLEKENYLEFKEDYIFKSPSEASSIVLGKQSPGPLDWKDINGVSLKDK